MLITGAQKVLKAMLAFIKARPSRPMVLPVALHRLRLKLADTVMGSAVLVAPGSSAV
jgi:hypothetical protein